jgi:hypothetical protein
LKIGIIGGVGRMGGGLAFRLARRHDVLITSRNYEKAVQTAKKLETDARAFHKDYMQGSINGASDEDAIKRSETIIITIPSQSVVAVMHELRAYFRQDQIVISTIVSMKKSHGVFRYVPLSKSGTTSSTIETIEQKSAAELIQEIVKPARVVSSFHTVPAAYLTDTDKVLDVDVFVAGDDDVAIGSVGRLICEIPNLRPLKAGPLENSMLIEAMVPLLLTVSTLNNLKEPSIRVVPWIPAAYDGCLQFQ